MSTAYWICGAITAISAYVSLGYSVAGLRGAVGAERTGSMYALARSVALAIVATIALFVGAMAFLIAITIAMVIVQAIDAVIGSRIRDPLKTFGPAVTAIVNLGALVWLLLS